MIWEAALWTALQAADGAGVPIEWVVPASLITWIQKAIVDYGYPTIGTMRQWGTREGWEFVVFAMFVGLSLTALAFALRFAKAIRDWFG